MGVNKKKANAKINKIRDIRCASLCSSKRKKPLKAGKKCSLCQNRSLITQRTLSYQKEKLPTADGLLTPLLPCELK